LDRSTPRRVRRCDHDAMHAARSGSTSSAGKTPMEPRSVSRGHTRCTSLTYRRLPRLRRHAADLFHFKLFVAETLTADAVQLLQPSGSTMRLRVSAVASRFAVSVASHSLLCCYFHLEHRRPSQLRMHLTSARVTVAVSSPSSPHSRTHARTRDLQLALNRRFGDSMGARPSASVNDIVSTTSGLFTDVFVSGPKRNNL
jgi:hypothetical protein